MCGLESPFAAARCACTSIGRMLLSTRRPAEVEAALKRILTAAPS